MLKHSTSAALCYAKNNFLKITPSVLLFKRKRCCAVLKGSNLCVSMNNNKAGLLMCVTETISALLNPIKSTCLFLGYIRKIFYKLKS